MDNLAEHPADRAERQVVGEYWDVPGPRSVAWHSHRRGQLIHTKRGCVSVMTGDALFVVPPQRAVWLPPETPHAARYPREVAFRGIFVAPALCAELPDRPTLVQIDALTRELIAVAARLPWSYAAERSAVCGQQLVGIPPERGFTPTQPSPIKGEGFRRQRGRALKAAATAFSLPLDGGGSGWGWNTDRASKD